MRAAPIRLFNALLWPLTIWVSLTHLAEHPADDYVERTSPIVATAIAFWIGLTALAILANPAVLQIAVMVEDEELISQVQRAPGVIVDVLWFFVPVIYLVGFWLFTSRDAAFPR